MRFFMGLFVRSENGIMRVNLNRHPTSETECWIETSIKLKDSTFEIRRYRSRKVVLKNHPDSPFFHHERSFPMGKDDMDVHSYVSLLDGNQPTYQTLPILAARTSENMTSSEMVYVIFWGSTMGRFLMFFAKLRTCQIV